MRHLLVLTACLFFLNYSLFAQENNDDAVSWDKKNLGFQFDYINQKSTSYQEYKVVRKDWLLGLKSRTLDTVSVLNKELKSIKETSASQITEVTQLKSEIDVLQNKLQTAIDDKETMSFLGINTSKSQYNVIVWLIIGVLFLLLLLSIFKSRRAISAAALAKTALKTVEDDFDGYKRIAIEREQKVRRQLQDEILKQKKGK